MLGDTDVVMIVNVRLKPRGCIMSGYSHVYNTNIYVLTPSCFVENAVFGLHT